MKKKKLTDNEEFQNFKNKIENAIYYLERWKKIKLKFSINYDFDRQKGLKIKVKKA